MDWAASWSEGVDRFDRYSKTLYCACVQLVTYSEWRVGSTAQKTPIFNVTSTLVFLTVRLSVGDIFSQEYATHIRILYKKNYRNWTSGFWDIYIVLFLWTDRYSVRAAKFLLFKKIPGTLKMFKQKHLQCRPFSLNVGIGVLLTNWHTMASAQFVLAKIPPPYWPNFLFRKCKILLF